MKKIIIVIILASTIFVPAFARTTGVYVGGGVSASISFDNGAEVSSIDVYADAKYETLEAKLGYTFSLDRNPAVSGVFVDLTYDIRILESPVYVRGGIGTDFHFFDESLISNTRAVVGVELTLPVVESVIIGPAVEASYCFNNKTGAPAFVIDAGVVVLYGLLK